MGVVATTAAGARPTTTTTSGAIVAAWAAPSGSFVNDVVPPVKPFD